MNARHNGKSENTPSRMWKWEWRGRRGSTYNTVNSQMSNWGGGGTGQAKLVAGRGGGCSGGCMESNEPSPIRVCRLRGSGPCLLADKVNGKSVFHARSINTAPARRDKFL